MSDIFACIIFFVLMIFYMQLDILYYSLTQHFQNLIIHLYGALYSYENNFIIFCFGSPFLICTTNHMNTE